MNGSSAWYPTDGPSTIGKFYRCITMLESGSRFPFHFCGCKWLTTAALLQNIPNAYILSNSKSSFINTQVFRQKYKADLQTINWKLQEVTSWNLLYLVGCLVMQLFSFIYHSSTPGLSAELFIWLKSKTEDIQQHQKSRWSATLLQYICFHRHALKYSLITWTERFSVNSSV